MLVQVLYLEKNRVQIVKSPICVCLFVFAEAGGGISLHGERHWRNKAELKMNLETTSRARDDD